MRTKTKLLHRLTMASAMPDRLIGLRSNMRETCQGSTGGGGFFSVSMFCPSSFGFFMLDSDFYFIVGWLVGRLRDCRDVETVLVLVVVPRHFSIPPRPVHGVNIWVEEHLVEVPNN